MQRACSKRNQCIRIASLAQEASPFSIPGVYSTLTRRTRMYSLFLLYVGACWSLWFFGCQDQFCRFDDECNGYLCLQQTCSKRCSSNSDCNQKRGFECNTQGYCTCPRTRKSNSNASSNDKPKVDKNGNPYCFRECFSDFDCGDKVNELGQFCSRAETDDAGNFRYQQKCTCTDPCSKENSPLCFFLKAKQTPSYHPKICYSSSSPDSPDESATNNDSEATEDSTNEVPSQETSPSDASTQDSQEASAEETNAPEQPTDSPDAGTTADTNEAKTDKPASD